MKSKKSTKKDSSKRQVRRRAKRSLPLTNKLISEAKEMLELSYIRNGIAEVPDWMPKQKKLIKWATKTAKLIAGKSI